MRERHYDYNSIKNQARITPAYAGKTSQNPSLYGLLRDHPRVCGKDSTAIISSLCTKGSPPRMRERRNKGSRLPTGAGITPAYAGKTYARRRLGDKLRDHPRVCGKD